MAETLVIVSSLATLMGQALVLLFRVGRTREWREPVGHEAFGVLPRGAD